MVNCATKKEQAQLQMSGGHMGRPLRVRECGSLGLGLGGRGAEQWLMLPTRPLHRVLE